MKNVIELAAENKTDEKIRYFKAKQGESFEFKVRYAEIRAWEFYKHPEIAGSCYVAVGGLDIRLTDRDTAALLGRMRGLKLHFAWDDPREDLEPYLERFARWYPRKSGKDGEGDPVRNIPAWDRYAPRFGVLPAREYLYRCPLCGEGIDWPEKPMDRDENGQWCHDQCLYYKEAEHD